MSRIAATFTALQAQGRKALIPYITAGDPYADATVDIMQALADAGADILELGIPFSDPMADGPVIQKASERALVRGIGLNNVLEMVQGFRRLDNLTPVVLMGYANPIERYGLQRFVEDAHSAGVDGVLVVDYPPEECTAFAQALRQKQMDPIFLLAPTSTEKRMQQVGQLASGYVYYVSLKGVTGAANLDIQAVAQMVPKIKRHVSVPVGVGFGIRDAQTAQAVAQVSDAVVVGSALVQHLEQQTRENVAAAAREWLKDLRVAMDTAC
jgi:tryptophan synthase alpha chain